MNDEDKPEPADEMLAWILIAFIVFMLIMMAIRSYLT